MVTGLLQRLIADLRRPGGGWTTGVATILAPLLILTLNAANAWPLPRWTATGAALVLLVLHMSWGAVGYYPNTIR